MNLAYSNTILLGLGNKGSEFLFTPHNIGHHIIDNIVLDKTLEQSQITIIKNKEFMNNAGKVLGKYLINKDKTRLIVICDDIDLELGLMRVRYGHSSNGHNGLKSIHHTWQQDYWLVKIGFCPNIEEDQDSYNLRRYNSAQYVLKPLKGVNKINYQKIITVSSQLISAMIKEGDLRNQTIDLLGEDKGL